MIFKKQMAWVMAFTDMISDCYRARAAPRRSAKVKMNLNQMQFYRLFKGKVCREECALHALCSV